MELTRSIRTMQDLVLAVVRLRWDKALGEKNKEAITLAATRAGLLDEDGRPTPIYFALMSDAAEQLARELTAQIKLCACGCGRKAKLGGFALKGCRFTSRLKKVRDPQKRPETPAISLGNFDTFSA